MADVLKKTPSPVPKVFLFFGAEVYQISYLLKKANLCPKIKYGDLKKIVLDSGMYGLLKDKDRIRDLFSKFYLNGCDRLKPLISPDTA